MPIGWKQKLRKRMYFSAVEKSPRDSVALHFLCGGSRLSVEKIELKRYGYQVLSRKMDNLYPLIKKQGFTNGLKNAPFPQTRLFGKRVPQNCTISPDTPIR
ncbi:hypothetical protein [Paenibacillus thiaminolyticus]|uniref:hypothetical protein n=1 Tax=Paenibacillus thiaminolyticus TaxID=49283 RepID=UPI0025433C9E|nr:hypothetical protein [Paenibacillus thiaminolyticus]WII36082.1 hypothetical protein O0V01_20695 [Paenibacillus thiaminolyticus]